jgi:Uma2 family endonuclease
LLRAFAERPGVRLTYDRGELEIIALLRELDCDGPFLCHLVFVLTEELALPLKGGGSTTLRRRARRCGIEADDCFWIANAQRMAGRRRLDLRTDPPPDLAIEVADFHSSMDRLGIYARLGLPEVWRLEGDTLAFYVLAENLRYASAATSRSFPLVVRGDLLPFLRQARQAGDQNAVTRQFRQWVRQRQAANP